jgi:hypothetical protein
VGPENIDFLSPNGPLRSLLFQVLGGGGGKWGKAITRAIGRGFENLDFFEPNYILFARCHFMAQKSLGNNSFTVIILLSSCTFLNNLDNN